MTVIRGTEMPFHEGNGIGYVYPETATETKAAALLRSLGWSVTAPSCPVCHGMGYLNQSITESGAGTKRDPITYTVTSDPCPNGCVTPAWVL